MTIKKSLNDPDNHDGVVTHLEPDILECEQKWALGSITMKKVSGGDRIPAELFQILKDDVVKVQHSIRQQIWKTQQWSQNQKRSGFIPIPKQGSAKELPYDPAIPLLGIYLKKIKTLIQKDICTLMFRAGASQVVLVVKNPPANAGDIKDEGSTPGTGRSLGGGNGNPQKGSQKVRHDLSNLAC